MNTSIIACMSHAGNALLCIATQPRWFYDDFPFYLIVRGHSSYILGDIYNTYHVFYDLKGLMSVLNTYIHIIHQDYANFLTIIIWHRMAQNFHIIKCLPILIGHFATIIYNHSDKLI